MLLFLYGKRNLKIQYLWLKWVYRSISLCKICLRITFGSNINTLWNAIDRSFSFTSSFWFMNTFALTHTVYMLSRYGRSSIHFLHQSLSVSLGRTSPTQMSKSVLTVSQRSHMCTQPLAFVEHSKNLIVVSFAKTVKMNNERSKIRIPDNAFSAILQIRLAYVSYRSEC